MVTLIRGFLICKTVSICFVCLLVHIAPWIANSLENRQKQEKAHFDLSLHFPQTAASTIPIRIEGRAHSLQTIR